MSDARAQATENAAATLRRSLAKAGVDVDLSVVSDARVVVELDAADAERLAGLVALAAGTIAFGRAAVAGIARMMEKEGAGR